MNTSGFYKKELFELLYASNSVDTPNNQLIKSAKDSYIYPVDGWFWFDSAQAAYDYFGLPYTEHVYDNKTAKELAAEAIRNNAAIAIATLFGKPAKTFSLGAEEINSVAKSVQLIKIVSEGGILSADEAAELETYNSRFNAITAIRKQVAIDIANIP